MMPELGDHAIYVLSAYGVTLVLLTALVARSVLRSKTARRALDTAEARRGRSSSS